MTLLSSRTQLYWSIIASLRENRELQVIRVKEGNEEWEESPVLRGIKAIRFVKWLEFCFSIGNLLSLIKFRKSLINARMFSLDLTSISPLILTMGFFYGYREFRDWTRLVLWVKTVYRCPGVVAMIDPKKWVNLVWLTANNSSALLRSKLFFCPQNNQNFPCLSAIFNFIFPYVLYRYQDRLTMGKAKCCCFIKLSLV